MPEESMAVALIMMPIILGVSFWLATYLIMIAITDALGFIVEWFSK